MTDALLRTVSSYDSPDLKSVVRELVGFDASIVEWLGQADPSRLVVVKPNWVQESRQDRPDVWEPVITHPSLILAIVEILADLMKGAGTICLCDAVHTYGDFAAITGRGNLLGHLEEVRTGFPSLRIEVVDLRREVWIVREEVVVERRPNLPDARGYVKVDLGSGSLFEGYPGEGRYYGADYDHACVNQHHGLGRHEYLLAGSPMKCDLLVNVPKLKTHKKTGITGALKNLVGINGDKNWLPHFVQGTPRQGGDEFSDSSMKFRLERRLKKIGQRAALKIPFLGAWAYRKSRNIGKHVLGDSSSTVRGGNWEGNDTCWRMALDLNRALLFADADGRMGERRNSLRYLAIMDGIVGGEGNGPLCPDPVPSNVLIAGSNPAIVDAVAAQTMGFEPARLPIVSQAFARHRWPIADMSPNEVRVSDERAGKDIALSDVAPAVLQGFRPHFGWPSLRRST